MDGTHSVDGYYGMVLVVFGIINARVGVTDIIVVCCPQSENIEELAREDCLASPEEMNGSNIPMPFRQRCRRPTSAMDDTARPEH